MFKVTSVISGLLALAGSLSAQVEPHAGQWKTWILGSGSAVRLSARPHARTDPARYSRIPSPLHPVSGAAPLLSPR